jgi:thiol-disulfide isomerase/thioredoxin
MPRRIAAALFVTILITAACASAPAASSHTPTPSLDATRAHFEEWVKVKMTDVRSGEPFSIRDFAGKVVLIESMAMWCPNCQRQQDQVKRLHTLLANPPDLVSVSLDVDLHESPEELKAYAEKWGYDWYFAIAPLEVTQALGNLYSAEYLNSPISPMLLIDRDGNAYGLPYGLKGAESLQLTLDPYLQH